MTHSLVLTLDGVPLENVVSVTGLTAEVDTIELKQQGPNGRYVVKQIPGLPKPGQFTVSQLVSDSTTIRDWHATVRRGDIAAARKTCAVAIVDDAGQTLRTFTFRDCWLQSVGLGAVTAGGSDPLTETLVVCYTESTVG